ncbi:MAG: 3-phosphoshikimate 1-carboxyvinyltransferase [Solobacterium sp.]|nr:3-phosphoshikimate 1-carboxyvinyltransferase [Solobacterium sp.]
MIRTIRKGNASAAEFILPPGKSETHRAILAAMLADGVSHLHHTGKSQDILATIEAAKAFGAVIKEEGNSLQIEGHGIGVPHGIIDCHESGSTLRFLIPLAALSDTPVTFHLAGRLPQRPLDVYEEIFARQSLRFEKNGEYLTVQGPLRAGKFPVRGDISSQFITGLLFALPLLEEDSTIRLTSSLESAPYVTMTIAQLKKSGIAVNWQGNVLHIPGKQSYRPIEQTIDGDDSQAAFLAMIPYALGIPVTIRNMPHDSIQADHALIEILEKMGAVIEETTDGYRIHPSSLHGAEIDLSDCTDLGPALFALSTLAHGTTRFTHCGRLRYKESDRIAAMEEELQKFGADFHSDADTVIVNGPLHPYTEGMLSSHGDHRIAMALIMLALACTEDVQIEGTECVAKSWPEFYAVLEEAGVLHA